MFVLYAIIAPRIQYPACSIEYRASRIENHGAYGTISTTVEEPLQISSFLTNKANFRKSQMNVSPVITAEYENNSNWTLGENKPNTKPIKANSKPIKANKMPKQSQNKANQTQLKPISEGKKCCCV